MSMRFVHGVVVAVLPVCAAIALAPSPLASRVATIQRDSVVTPALPAARVSTVMPALAGRVIKVGPRDNLQKAIDGARSGDAIELAPGASYTGPITLGVHPGAGWVVIRSQTSAADLPAAGTRVTPANAPRMPKIVARTQSDRALRTAPGASHWRIIGIEVTVDSTMPAGSSILELGDGQQATLAAVPDHIVLDRVYVHGWPGTNVHRCISLQSAATAIVDSWISECHGRGQDTQAIAVWDGPGPYRIENNFLSGAGETVIFGGSDPMIPNLIPSDIEIRHNHFYKPVSWQRTWLVKNHLEIKNAQRVLIEGNVFDGVWTDGQTGYALVWKSENQSGAAPWSVCQDVTFRYNRVRNAGAGLEMAGQLGSNPVTVRARRVLLRDNVFEHINERPYSGDGRMFIATAGVSDVAFVHNTMVSNGAINSLVALDGAPAASNFVFIDNIAVRGMYGVKGSGQPEGRPTLDAFAPRWRWNGNVIIGSFSAPYPQGTMVAATPASVQFVNYATGNYTLAKGSPYARRASDGRDPGANIAAVDSATAGVVMR